MTVQEIQEELVHLGYDPGIIDGLAGPKTRRATRRFQLDRGLTPDGIAGPLTFAALLAAQAEIHGDQPHPEDELDSLPPELSEDFFFQISAAASMLGISLSASTQGLMLVGIRGWVGGTAVENRFDLYNDTIITVESSGRMTPWKASVDPGKLRESNPRGIAHLLPGLYSYRLGLHRKRETALVQAGPVTVERYFDEGVLNGKITRESGWFGINIHRGGSGNRVANWSAGCQVIHGRDWPSFIAIVLAAASAGQRRFLYLLLNGTDL